MILKLFTALAETAAVETTEAAQTVQETFVQTLEETGATTAAAARGSFFSVPSGPMLIIVIVALIVALIVVSSFKAQMKTAHKKTGAAEYALKNTFHLDRQSDYFLYESVQRVPIRQETPQGGNGPRK